MTTIGDAATVVDPGRQPHVPPRIPNGGFPKWALWLIIAMFAAGLVVVVKRNFDLTKRAVHAEQVADERAEEIRQMAQQCGLAARVSLEKLSQPKEEAADDDQVDEERPALDAGIDGENKAQRW